MSKRTKLKKQRKKSKKQNEQKSKEILVLGITDSRKTEKGIEWQVQWADGDETWEPEENLTDPDGTINGFLLEYKKNHDQFNLSESESEFTPDAHKLLEVPYDNGFRCETCHLHVYSYTDERSQVCIRCHHIKGAHFKIVHEGKRVIREKTKHVCPHVGDVAYLCVSFGSCPTSSKRFHEKEIKQMQQEKKEETHFSSQSLKLSKMTKEEQQKLLQQQLEQARQKSMEKAKELNSKRNRECFELETKSMGSTATSSNSSESTEGTKTVTNTQLVVASSSPTNFPNYVMMNQVELEQELSKVNEEEKRIKKVKRTIEFLLSEL